MYYAMYYVKSVYNVNSHVRLAVSISLVSWTDKENWPTDFLQSVGLLVAGRRRSFG